MESVTMVTEKQASEISKALEIPGSMCIVTTAEGEERFTMWTSENLNDFEVMALVKEVALACRLARLGLSPPNEEKDTLGVDDEAKVCITYRRSEQDMTFMRKNLTYMDAAIACEVVAGELHNILHGGTND